jgi:hypothetical protein
MSFPENLRAVENLLFEDSERCLQLVASPSFISSLFHG